MVTHTCPVCGCGELRCDEVDEPERALLVECPRCELRRMVRLAPVLRAPLRAVLEAAEVAAA
jgi:transcription elongation factor Elf1